MSYVMTRAAIIGAAIMVAPLAQAATLDGLTLSAEYFHPDTATVYPDATTTGPFTVGVGPDAVINVEGVTAITMDFFSNSLAILFNTTLTNPTWVNSAFNGLRIELQSPGSFTAFSLVNSDIGTVSASFDANTLWINWAGASYVEGSALSFDIGYDAPAPIPLPAGLPLLALALGGLAVLGRNRRAA